jgi:hypothetical protein
MSGTMSKNLDTFKGLCGQDAMPNVVLVTTRWEGVQQDVGTQREEALKKTFWAGMLANGCSVARFDGRPASAWDIIHSLLSKVPTQVHLPKELVDDRKPFDITDAAIALKNAVFKYANYLLNWKFVTLARRRLRRQGAELIAQDLT